jgi:MoaA/NifB/PqqE/SkfB family radical SAM enzyme
MNILDKIKMIKNHWGMRLYPKDSDRGLFFYVTNKCNARCLMCFNWKDLNKNVEDLSLDEIDKFSKNIGPLGSLVLGGGEPFLREDLFEICQIFIKNNGVKKIAIPTNCLSVEKIIESSNKILELPVYFKMILSLDGLEETHDRIRGVKGTFKKVLETYEKLNPKIQVSINTTISSENENDISDVIDFVDNNLKRIRFHTFEMIRGHYNESRIRPPVMNEQLLEKISKSKTLSRDECQKAMYTYYMKLAMRILKEKRQVIPCRAAFSTPVIDATGNVYHCEILPSIGNIKDNNFKDIWHSRLAKEQKEYIAHKKCYCTHYCWQIQNITMSLPHFLKAIFSYK